jgi:signal transduction histidine kinase
MTHPTIAQLRPIDLFTELTDEQLGVWARAASVAECSAGSVLIEEGRVGSVVTLVITGTIEALVDEGGMLEHVGDHVAPTWIGATAALTGSPFALTMRAATDILIASIAPEEFVELAIAHRTVFARVMAQVRPVTARLTAREQNRERLASLGTMAAGLAHELNNPAAAARRTSAELADALAVLSSTIGIFVESGLERSEAVELVALQREALAAGAAGTPLDQLDAADAEDALADALTAAGVADGWRIAEPLTAAGVDGEFVARVSAVAGPATDPTLRWIAASVSARDLARELSEATQRMSTLVTAIKAYAYMDRGSLVEVDIHEGLETTLTILAHKLKHTAITVKRDYDHMLPRVTVHGAELNQVWTNLLDNAIDAVGGTGTIAITTRRDGGCVEVDIADDGPGVADEARDHLFDPFFTTKGVGAGTGLGLDTARRILADRHHGSLTFESAPGATVFRARLPIVPPG